MLDAAGLRFEQPVDGESLLPVAEGGAGRESLLVETYGHGFGAVEPGRAVIMGDHKLVAWQNYANELYDLAADPYELRNLYSEPSAQDTRRTLEDELREWLRKTNDRDFGQPVTDGFRARDAKRLQELMARRARVNDVD